jgi:hypothetical protein
VPRNTDGLKKGGPGRPKGVPNKATVEAKEVCAKMVDDPVYQQALRLRLHRGKLAPAVECMLWHYAKGKPPDKFEHTGADGGPVQFLDVKQLSADTIRRILDETESA